MSGANMRNDVNCNPGEHEAHYNKIDLIRFSEISIKILRLFVYKTMSTKYFQRFLTL